jgi:hypothetical protein
MTLWDNITHDRRFEAEVLVKAATLYAGKRLDVHWCVLREV